MFDIDAIQDHETVENCVNGTRISREDKLGFLRISHRFGDSNLESRAKETIEDDRIIASPMQHPVISGK